MTWDEYFLNIIDAVKGKSKDRSSKVGATISGPGHEIKSVGYNGFPRCVDDDVEARHERPLKYLFTEHAERNAIYNAVRDHFYLCTIHVGWFPCAPCARAIIQVGIAAVVIDARDKEESRKKWSGRGWEESMLVGLEMLLEAGVEVHWSTGEEITLAEEQRSTEAASNSRVEA